MLSPMTLEQDNEQKSTLETISALPPTGPVALGQVTTAAWASVSFSGRWEWWYPHLQAGASSVN